MADLLEKTLGFALILLLPLATVHVASHTKLGLLLGLLALAALALTPRLRREPGPA
jgi:predicted cobalt transporter CbtA